MSCSATGCPKKSRHSWETKTLGTSYSETTYLLDLKLWQQGVLMSTPCCQISMVYRLVVSEHEVPKVLVSQECRLFFGTPCILPVMYEWLYAGMHPCMKENPLNTGLQNICDNYLYSLWTLVTSRGVLTFKNLILGPNLEKNKKAKPLLSFGPQSEIFWAPSPKSGPPY